MADTQNLRYGTAFSNLDKAITNYTHIQTGYALPSAVKEYRNRVEDTLGRHWNKYHEGARGSVISSMESVTAALNAEALKTDFLVRRSPNRSQLARPQTERFTVVGRAIQNCQRKLCEPV